jgi:polar amino acid transport system substrate-binding protein
VTALKEKGRRRAGLVLGAAALATALAGCASSSATSSAIPGPVQAAAVAPPGSQFNVKVSPLDPSTTQTCDGHRLTASLAPQGALPEPGQMPAGSEMATIARRGYLLAGVDQNTLLWAYRNPQGNLAGFDIDMVDQVAQAIFGPSWSSHIHYVIVPNANRVNAVAAGQVDLVAETMTITCQREQTVDFSTEYYDASQGVLVANDSPITSLATLAGKRVCAASGSTSLGHLAWAVPSVKLVSVANQPDCLVMLQQGQIDAISTDDTILQGLAAQDPNVHLVSGLRLSDEPYGMAISKAHPDLTRFVNAVLAQERADNTWSTIWSHWVGPVVFHTRLPSPPQVYYRS